MSDSIIHGAIVGLIALVSFVSKKLIFDPQQATQAELLKHVNECNEMPKKLILEKLDRLTEKQDIQFDFFKSYATKTDNEFTLIRERQHDLNSKVHILIGKLNGTGK